MSSPNFTSIRHTAKNTPGFMPLIWLPSTTDRFPILVSTLVAGKSTQLLSNFSTVLVLCLDLGRTSNPVVECKASDHRNGWMLLLMLCPSSLFTRLLISGSEAYYIRLCRYS